MVILALQALVGLGSLVCFILVIVQIFQHGETGVGVGCLVGLLLCGLGALAAFIYGWVKAKPWNIQNIMLAWTACFVISVILNVISLSAGGPMIPGGR